MKLQDLILRNHIILDLKAKDKLDVITQMGKYLASCHDLPNPEMIIQKTLQRESEMSTGIGYGIAIPHCRLDTVPHCCMVAARCAEDVDFNSIDEQPVRLVFLMVSPSNTATEHSQILSTLSKILAMEKARQDLLKAITAEEFLSVIIQGENAIAG